MRDVLYLQDAAQAEVILKPARAAVLRELAEPRTCSEVAERLGQSPQRVYYHVKQLEAAGAVEPVANRSIRNLTEVTYQAVARRFWLSPEIIRLPAPDPDDGNLARLLDIAEQIQRDVSGLTPADHPLPSIGVTGRVLIKPEQRSAFLGEVRAALTDLFTRYGGAEGEPFTLAVACYPDPTQEDRP